MDLISHDCEEIQNSYLWSLEDKLSRQIWISSLIRNLWDTAWDMWIFINHTLHTTYGQTKTEIITPINKRVTYHNNQGMTGLSEIFHFLFKTNIHTLLSFNVCQLLPWLVAKSSACQCPQRKSNKGDYPPDVDQLLLICIHTSCIIPKLTTFYQNPSFRTAAGPDKSHSLLR